MKEIVIERLLNAYSFLEEEKEQIKANPNLFTKVYLLGCIDIKS